MFIEHLRTRVKLEIVNIWKGVDNKLSPTRVFKMRCFIMRYPTGQGDYVI